MVVVSVLLRPFRGVLGAVALAVVAGGGGARVVRILRLALLLAVVALLLLVVVSSHLQGAQGGVQSNVLIVSGTSKQY